MSDAFEQKKRWSQEQFASASGQPTHEITPRAMTETIAQFAASLGGTPQFVPVKQDQYGLYNWCFNGVLEKAKHDGGKIRFGWTIWEWPQIFLNAEFHAVWVSSDNELIDITPKPDGETRILFVPDETYPADFNFNKRPINRRFRLAQAPDYAALAEAEISRMKLPQLEHAKKRASKTGVSLIEWVAAKQSRAQLPLLVDQLIEACSSLARKVDELRGEGNRFSPDLEYSELVRRKIALLQATKLAARIR